MQLAVPRGIHAPAAFKGLARDTRSMRAHGVRRLRTAAANLLGLRRVVL